MPASDGIPVADYRGLTAPQRADVMSIAGHTWKFYTVDIDPAVSLPMNNLTFAGGSATPSAYGRYTSAASIGGVPVGCGLGPGSWTDR